MKRLFTFLTVIAAVVAISSMVSCSKDNPNGGNGGEVTPVELNTDGLEYYLSEMDRLLALESNPESGYTAEAFDALEVAKTAVEEALVKAEDGTFTSQDQITEAENAAAEAIQTFKDSYVYVARPAELYVPGKTDVSNYIELGAPGAFDGYATISVELWFKGEDNMNSQQQGSIISNFYAPEGKFYGWEVNTWANSTNGEAPYKIRVSRGFNQGLVELQPMFDNYAQWHYIVYTHDASAQKSVLYLDGEVLAESGVGEWPAITSDPMAPDHAVQMCAFKNLTDPNNPKAVNGSMKKVRFWDYALTADQVKDNMNAEVTGTEDGLIAAWDFTETVENPQNILDKTGNHVAKVLGDKVEWRKIDEAGQE